MVCRRIVDVSELYRWWEKGPLEKHFQTGGAVKVSEPQNGRTTALGRGVMPRCIESAGISRTVARSVIVSCTMFQF